MRRLVFMSNDDPPVEVSSVTCLDDAGMISTASGKKRADEIEVGDMYRWPDGCCLRVDVVEVS